MPEELRLAITAEAYDRLLAFFRDGLGLEPAESWSNHGRGETLRSGRAVIEVLDQEHAAFVDGIETGNRRSGPIRLAFAVPDLEAAVDRAVRHGASLISRPVKTPWGDVNARLASPEGLEITLFQRAPASTA